MRAQGYALDDEENRVGIRCLGAPVRDYAGQVIAAISVSGPSFRFTGDRAAQMVSPLLSTAAGISEKMGWRGGRCREGLREGEDSHGKDRG